MKFEVGGENRIAFRSSGGEEGKKTKRKLGEGEKRSSQKTTIIREKKKKERIENQATRVGRKGGGHLQLEEKRPSDALGERKKVFNL